MPQFNFNDFAPQLIWLAISFVLLYFIMSRLALPRVGQVLQERRDRVASDLATAAKLREDTEKAISHYEQALAEAKSRAQAIARQSRDEMTRDLERQRAEADETIAARSADAETRINGMKEAALSHVGEIATDTAEALVARLLGRSLPRSELQDTVNEVLGK
jgi:F-type H+-transporting ATPase subunit b